MGCGSIQPEDDPAVECRSCGGLLDVEQPDPPVRGPALRQLFDDRLGVARGPLASGVWRFREVVLSSTSADQVVTYPEGNTPVLSRHPVDRWAGVDGLLLKHEGHNPTGSFKDRGMTVAVAHAVTVGATALGCATTGNTGASLAAYAAAAGLPALVLAPRGSVAVGKLAQVLAYGGRAVLVRGDFDDCLRLVRESVEELGAYLLNSVNPFRLEGQKTIMFELLQQLAWNEPDWIVFPAGNLGNTSAFGKALCEAVRWGLIARSPRLAAIQAEGASPFAAGYRDGFRSRPRVRAETVATAIRIGDPASWDRGVRAIRDTNGVVTAVPDSEILEAKAVVDAAGIGCEPASAAAVAGVRRLVREGVVRPGERVVAILTGHLLKDPTVPSANQPVEIDARISELARVLRDRRTDG